MKKYKTLFCIVAVIITVHVSGAIPSQKEIDAAANRTLKEWEIPGLALSIVHQGKQLKCEGYGVKERGGSDKVDADTLFQIASLTKAFTGLTASMLVEEGKIQWEQPIHTLLPTIRLKDPVATEQMTLRDLLSHRTGLPGTGTQKEWRLWWHMNRTADDLLARLIFIDPAHPFRSHFTYNNGAYIIASRAIAQAAGMPWTEICEKQIFLPLDMKRTNLSYSSLTKENNAAAPHLPPSIRKEPLPWFNCEFGAASGGINSCANDMARWLAYCLSSPPVFAATVHPQSLVEAAGLLSDTSIISWPMYTRGQAIANYGYGWMMYMLGNRIVYTHMGIVDGMQSILALVPSEQLGICILTNASSHYGHAALLNTLLDRFCGLEKTDWHAKGHQIKKSIEEKNQEIKQRMLNARNGEIKPTLELSAYAGTYTHPAYGNVRIGFQNNTLHITLFSHEEGTLDHWQKDQFAITGIASAPTSPWLIEFHTSTDQSKIISFTMPDLGVFTKTPNL